MKTARCTLNALNNRLLVTSQFYTCIKHAQRSRIASCHLHTYSTNCLSPPSSINYNIRTQTRLRKYHHDVYHLQQRWPTEIRMQSYATSALYVRPDNLSMVSVVELDLDLKNIFGRVQEMEKNLAARKMNFPFHKLIEDYRMLTELTSKLQQLEAEGRNIAEQMKHIVKGKQGSNLVEKKEELILRGREIRKELKNNQEVYWDLEERVVKESLRLPVDLLPNTPQQDVVLQEYGQKPDLNLPIKDHIQLGEKTNTIEFRSTSPGSYYLHAELAVLELHLMDKFAHSLQSLGFTQFSCPDMVKSIIMEACGKDISSSDQIYTLEQAEEGDKFDVTYHLCGGSSVGAFAAYLAKMNIAQSSLPIKAFSLGKFYSPEDDDTPEKIGLLRVSQSNRLEVFGGCINDEQATFMYNGYCDIMWQLCKNLHLPIRMVEKGSEVLSHTEAARREVQVWMPSLHNYITIANVALWNDFISRRLMITHGKADTTQSQGYIHTVHGSLLNTPHVIAAIMENFQTQGDSPGFKIPKLLMSSEGIALEESSK